MPSASRTKRRARRWRRRADFMGFGPCGCYCQTTPTNPYYGKKPQGLIIIATLGQSQAGGKPNVFAFDGDGNLKWKYDTGFFVGTNQTNRRVVNGICRDFDGNVYLSYSTTGSAVGLGIRPGDFTFGILKLDASGNLLQDWQPSGWTLNGDLEGTPTRLWKTQTAGNTYNRTAHLPDALYFNTRDGKIYWQHIAKLVIVASGTSGQRWDPISVLDTSFNELASYGGSNYVGISSGSQSAAASVRSIVMGFPGRVRVDVDGNLWIEMGNGSIQYPSSSGSDASGVYPTKVSPGGSLLVSFFATQPWTRAGVNTGKNCGIGNHNGLNGSRNGFDYAPDLGTKGYVLFPQSPNLNDDVTSWADNASRPDLAVHLNAGTAGTWCTSNKDACNNIVQTTLIGLKQHFVCADNDGMLNSAQHNPVWVKTYCDWTYGHGERQACLNSPTGATSVLYASGRLFFSMSGTDDANTSRLNRATVTNNPCQPVPTPTYNDRANYGVWVVDASNGAQQALRSIDDICNVTYGVTGALNGGAGVHGLAYHADSGSVVAVGQFNFPLSTGVAQLKGPNLFNFGFGLFTNWRVDLSSGGALALDATDVTCVFADNST